ncbi:serine/threonine protein kinase [Segniliparus rotundus DSM 44985]|uniref:non-specific serine/threonine protein kinase n=1 Tax=Segniliparus rotundus (strain ATCC BAA-972 / CDC 1076 / CIP 108378 / DSM 44985 / JCM 13578) TaxID=640132 RepID=D6ZF20_SEGRD|nr:protein kinase [Segniliparus rotundus]ADG97544.1 serine/threonine protein kinase [Segniliparus rotundus DSM 44985]
MTRSPVGPDPLVGTVLEGRYQVGEQIGSGGMCVVYRGFDRRLERPVAIKFAADHLLDSSGRLDDPRIAERFDFEARAVARLCDPALVAVFDQGSTGGRPYLVLEFIAGGTARQLLAERGPMPPYAAAALLEPVLRALGTAHRIGLVHGDVKPENILISEEGEVKITDFGSAAWSERNGSQPSPLEAFGTAAYLAPEQARSGAGEGLRAASDIYSAGVVLYELLTGALPFAGADAAELAEARLRHDVPPPSRAVDGVPLQFDNIVLRATERDPAARYPDADSMLRDLDRVRAELGLPRYSVPAPTAAPSLTGAHATAPTTAQQSTVDLGSVIPATGGETDPVRTIVENIGSPISETTGWREVAVGFIVVLLLGVVSMICGYFFAAFLEQQLG